MRQLPFSRHFPSAILENRQTLLTQRATDFNKSPCPALREASKRRLKYLDVCVMNVFVYSSSHFVHPLNFCIKFTTIISDTFLGARRDLRDSLLLVVTGVCCLHLHKENHRLHFRSLFSTCVITAEETILPYDDVSCSSISTSDALISLCPLGSWWSDKSVLITKLSKPTCLHVQLWIVKGNKNIMELSIKNIHSLISDTSHSVKKQYSCKFVKVFLFTQK